MKVPLLNTLACLREPHGVHLKEGVLECVKRQDGKKDRDGAWLLKLSWQPLLMRCRRQGAAPQHSLGRGRREEAVSALENLAPSYDCGGAGTSMASWFSSVVPVAIGKHVTAQWAHEPDSPQPVTSRSMVVVPWDPGDPGTAGAPTILLTQAVTPMTTVTSLHQEPRVTNNTGKKVFLLENKQTNKKGL